MPRVVRYGGLSLSGEVVRICDAAPQDGAVEEDDVFELLEVGAPAPGEAESGGPGTPAEGRAPGAPGPEKAEAPARRAEPAAMQAEVIQAAMAEAGRIIEDAVRQAEIRKAEILADAQYEADQMRQTAVAEGRQEGLAGVADDMRTAADQLQGAIAAFEGERAGFEAEHEEQLCWLAVEIAGKVLAKKVSANDAEMTQMVDKAVQTVRNESWIRVEVAQEMIRLIDSLTALYEGQAGIEVSGIPAAPGTVHIETPSGVVDASLETQLANLREYFSRNSE